MKPQNAAKEYPRNLQGKVFTKPACPINWDTDIIVFMLFQADTL